MENGLFLITGTSSGIGEALALRILQDGHTVLGVSRNRSSKINSGNYHHLSLDLSDSSRLGLAMEKVNEILNRENFEFACLINNASAIEPIGPIERLSPLEIESHVSIGLIAPMILTSLFIRNFSHQEIRKKVAFISSGAAFSPLADESVYCGSKAGLNMFARVVGIEQENKENGFEVISIGPGMVDTSMQRVARSKTSQEFALADFFKQAYEEGRLQDPDLVAEKILTILRNSYEQGKYISVSEV
jgi:benzil reductase ((S)-benzoin forming)